MKPFTTIESVAAYIDEDAVDTDIIFPARFLLLLDKTGLGKHAFHERRHAKAGVPPFILDTPPFDRTQILVARENFGTGSSREQAVWCLADFGIRCVIAASFGEIFFANCFKNGVLPIVKSGSELKAIREAAGSGETLVIDLNAQTITLSNGASFGFDIEAYCKHALLNGLDEIGLTLAEDSVDIDAFETRQRQSDPWLYLSGEQLRHFDDLERERALG
jgi:3-isopropylmalate/(R)-2-methylmalate dehydratase small subunit